LAERYRQIKRFLFLKTRLMVGTTTIKRIDLNPSQRDGVSAPAAVSRLEQKKNLLCDLRASAVKPGVERGEY